MILNEKNKPLIKTNPELTQMIKLEDHKLILKVIYIFKKLSRNMKDIKKIQVKLVEINTSELEWQRIKFCERISVFEDIAVEIIQNETQKKNFF